MSQIIKPYGPMMNDNAIQRIVRFVSNQDLIRARQCSKLALDMIDAFFDFLATDKPRTLDEFSKLKTDAMNWRGRYFQAYTLFTDRFLTDLFANISLTNRCKQRDRW